jgi:serine/threonine-protein kinase
MARATAADEVLLAAIERQGRMGRVSLRRIRGSDGAVLWTDAFDVPADPEGLRLLADVLGIRLRRAYPDHRPRPGTPEIDVRDEDYAAFLEVKQRVDSGQVLLEPEIARLEGIARRSPRFLEAQLLASRISLSLFRSTREPAHLDRARGFLRAAQELAPNDPRPLAEAFQVALAAGRQQEAESVLQQLDPLLPGDPEALALRARLAESQGRMEEALSHLGNAVQSAPSWQNLYRLADLEARTGRIAEAREHFAQIERDAPGNPWGLERLAYLELFYGDVAHAERLYQDLLRATPQRYYYTNLGLARFLLGRHGEAVAAYRKALELSPGHITVLLNLAEAEEALGAEDQAAALYLRALQRIEETEAAAALPPKEAMLKAQCLAHLGRPREAVEVTQQALRKNPDDPEIVYAAAVVYALIGDRSSALVNAQLALRKGIQPRWFTIPAFAALRDDPELRLLLAGPAGPR